MRDVFLLERAWVEGDGQWVFETQAVYRYQTEARAAAAVLFPGRKEFAPDPEDPHFGLYGEPAQWRVRSIPLR